MTLPRALVLLSALSTFILGCATHGESYFDALALSRDSVKSTDRMAWWRDARFGLFIHWGLYAIPAGEWKEKKDHGEWILTTGQIPVSEYEHFKDRFNPVEFNADEWVSVAKNAGMKYIVITSKHHDGFGLFDSKQTDYDVMSTPFKRDVLKELSEACRKEGIVLCWYHSIMDWHHPDYVPRREWESRPASGANFDRYVSYMRAQVTELLTHYGPIGVMWFDGEWESTWNHAYGQALYDLCRKLQPKVIVNNRVDVGRGGMAGMTAQGNYAGDFGTPEQEVPARGFSGVDWETCMTMNDHWGYNKNDHNFKSTKELIQTLCDVASKGGNFLLNVGPTADGVIPPTSVDRLADMGRWMSVNGEAIHDSEASPFTRLEFGRCTVKRKGVNTILYFHVFDWPKSGSLVIPGLGNDIVAARLLTANRALEASRSESDVKIQLPSSAPDDVCSVVALEVVGTPIVYEAPSIFTSADIFVMPTFATLGASSKDLEVRYTLDGSSPDASSALYKGRIHILDTTTIKARAFHRGKPVSEIAEKKLTRVSPAPGVFIEVSALRPGVISERFDGSWDRVPDLTALTPVSNVIVPGFRLEPADSEKFARRLSGWITLPEDNVYRFELDSDDGSKLYVDNQLLIDNDGLHPASVKGNVAALGRGSHRIRVEYFNSTGGKVLDVRFGLAAAKAEPIAERMLVHLLTEEPAPLRAVHPAEPGLRCETFDGTFSSIPDFTGMEPTSKSVEPTPVVSSADSKPMARRYTGFLVIPADGLYTISLTSVGGSQFTIDNVRFLINDGVQPTQEKSASRPLAAGAHPVVIEYCNSGATAKLEVKIAKDAETPRVVPANWWSN